MLIGDLGGVLPKYTQDQNRYEYIRLGLNAQETAIELHLTRFCPIVSLLYQNST